jgi:hypothetical protein
VGVHGNELADFKAKAAATGLRARDRKRIISLPNRYG